MSPRAHPTKSTGAAVRARWVRERTTVRSIALTISADSAERWTGSEDPSWFRESVTTASDGRGGPPIRLAEIRVHRTESAADTLVAESAADTLVAELLRSGATSDVPTADVVLTATTTTSATTATEPTVVVVLGGLPDLAPSFVIDVVDDALDPAAVPRARSGAAGVLDVRVRRHADDVVHASSSSVSTSQSFLTIDNARLETLRHAAGQVSDEEIISSAAIAAWNSTAPDAVPDAGARVRVDVPSPFVDVVDLDYRREPRSRVVAVAGPHSAAAAAPVTVTVWRSHTATVISVSVRDAEPAVADAFAFALSRALSRYEAAADTAFTRLFATAQERVEVRADIVA